MSATNSPSTGAAGVAAHRRLGVAAAEQAPVGLGHGARQEAIAQRGFEIGNEFFENGGLRLRLWLVNHGGAGLGATGAGLGYDWHGFLQAPAPA